MGMWRHAYLSATVSVLTPPLDGAKVRTLPILHIVALNLEAVKSIIFIVTMLVTQVNYIIAASQASVAFLVITLINGTTCALLVAYAEQMI